MLPTLTQKNKTLSDSQPKFNSSFFCINELQCYKNLAVLKKSIADHGLIKQPRALNHKGKYYIYEGTLRYKIAKKLGIATNIALDKLSPQEAIIKKIQLNKLDSPRPNPLQIAYILKLAKKLSINEDYLRGLISFSESDKYLKLLTLPVSIKKKLFHEPDFFKTAVLFGEFNDLEKDCFLSLTSKFNLNINQGYELCQAIKELEESNIKLLQDHEPSSNNKADGLINYIRGLLNPNIFALRTELHRVIDLASNSFMKFKYKDNFESTKFNIEIDVSLIKNEDNVLDHLINKKPHLQNLINLIKNGNL